MSKQQFNKRITLPNHRCASNTKQEWFQAIDMLLVLKLLILVARWPICTALIRPEVLNNYF